MNVVCVLKLGGDFNRDWVHNLKHGLNRHLRDFDFFCITDDVGVSPVWRIPIEHHWPGWWSKMELFRPGILEGPTLYMDLDTLPVGDLTDIAGYRGRFAMINDVFRTKPAQSGVMAWTPGEHTAAIWEAWMREPAKHMRRFRGDGEFLAAAAPYAERLQERYPGQIVSLKREANFRGKGPPEGARLVCGHGRPRLSDARAGWANRAWKEGWPPKDTKEAA